MADYDYLFSPIKVGPVTLKNRIVCAGHTNGLQDPTSFLSNERTRSYFEEKARGGAGLIILPLASVDEKADYYPLTSFGLWKDEVIPGIKEITDIAHKYDCKVFGGPGHSGAHSFCNVTVDEVPRDASQLPTAAHPHQISKELTKEEILEIEEKFAKASVRLIKAGCDGIELLIGHGKLIGNFLSEKTNKRTDEYGGSLENRCRFLLEIIDKTRQAIGKDYAISVRVLTFEMELGGYTIDDAVDVAKMLEATGQIDCIGLSLSTFSSTHIEGSPYYANFEPGWAGEYSRKFKEAVKLPVSAVSKINDPGLADNMIADGQCDFVYLCRSIIADPHFAKKAMENREEDICPCINCNQGCFGRAGDRSMNGLRCTVNPTAGEEARWGSWTFKKASSLKKVMIVGAGPAGLVHGVGDIGLADFLHRLAGLGPGGPFYHVVFEILRHLGFVVRGHALNIHVLAAGPGVQVAGALGKDAQTAADATHAPDNAPEARPRPITGKPPGPGAGRAHPDR